MPRENKGLMDMLYRTQGLEDVITGEEEKELKEAHYIASWVTSQALDSDLNFYIPSEEEQKWAYRTMKKLVEKHNYSSGVRKHDENGDLSPKF